MSEQTEPRGSNETRFTDIRRVDRTGSTNADLMALAAAGHRNPVVLVTDHQTDGRGRQHRRWIDRPGSSLLVSYLIEAEPAKASVLPLLAALAGSDAARGALGEDIQGAWNFPAGIGLKWPNDIVVGPHAEKKLAGILCESRVGDGVMLVVVGMGMNLELGPDHGLGSVPVDLAGLAEDVGFPVSSLDRDRLLAHYLTASERWLQALETGSSEMIIDSYRSRCRTIGRPVQFADLSGSQVLREGHAVDVDRDGALIVVESDGRRRIVHAGDVHLGSGTGHRAR